MAGRKQFDVGTALERAMRVFWQRGYADASLDLLGAATGLGRGSLYGAFGGKSALFRRCLDRYSATYGAQYDQALAAHPQEPVRAVEAFFDVVLDRLADPAVPDGCLIAQSAAQAAVLDEDSRARVQTLLQTQRNRVRAALTAPETDPAQLDDLATYIVAVNQALAVMSRAGTTITDLHAVANLACTTVATTLARRTAQQRTGAPR